jgi:hypothetical protein
MKSLILYLNENIVKVGSVNEPVSSLNIESNTFQLENIYFGDWVALRNAFNKIIGFKLIPFVKDDYLNQNILSASFTRLASNVLVERKGPYSYISVLIEPSAFFTEYDMNKIEAAILRNSKGDFIIRLDGFSEEEWQQFGFPIVAL